MAIKYPITVNDIDHHNGPILRTRVIGGGSCGQFVSIRPCDPVYEGKTYLGILLGDLATGVAVQFQPNDGKLFVAPAWYNPAIYVPDLKRVVFGYESWWGEIESEAHLRKITESDIQNVWYVQALKQLAEAQATPG